MPTISRYAQKDDELEKQRREALAKLNSLGSPAQKQPTAATDLSRAGSAVQGLVDARTGANRLQPGGPLTGSVPASPPQSPELDSLAKLRAQQEADKKAAQEDLAASKARALQTAEARAGAAGLGLSGGTTALLSDVNRQQDRSKVQALSDLDRSQRDAQFTEVQRLAAIQDLEEQTGQDINGDGVKGKPLEPGETPESVKKDEQSAARRDRVAGLTSVDIGNLDFDTGPGTKEEPFEIDRSDLDDMAREGFEFTKFKYRVQSKDTGHDQDFTLLVDQNGRYYIVRG